MAEDNQRWLHDIRKYMGATKARTLLDVGANTGQVALKMLTQFPESTIHCFEPVAETFEALCDNLKIHENAHPYKLALGREKESRTINLYEENNLCNTFLDNLEEVWATKTGTEIVNVNTLDNFYHDKVSGKIDILKIDVEGYEMEVLRGAKDNLTAQNIRFIYAEVGFTRGARHQHFCELCDFLQAYNFDICNFYEIYKHGSQNQYILFCNVLFAHRSNFYYP